MGGYPLNGKNPLKRFWQRPLVLICFSPQKILKLWYTRRSKTSQVFCVWLVKWVKEDTRGSRGMCVLDVSTIIIGMLESSGWKNTCIVFWWACLCLCLCLSISIPSWFLHKLSENVMVRVVCEAHKKLYWLSLKWWRTHRVTDRHTPIPLKDSANPVGWTNWKCNLIFPLKTFDQCLLSGPRRTFNSWPFRLHGLRWWPFG